MKQITAPLRSQVERDKLVLDNQNLVYWVWHKHKSWLKAFPLRPEDAVQEGFVGLVRAADLWRPEDGVAFSTYAVTAIFHGMERAARQALTIRLPCHHPLSRALRVGSLLHPDERKRRRYYHEPVAPVGRMDTDLWDWLLNLVQESYRETVRLHYVEGMSYAEIARRLGVSPQCIRQRVERVIRELRYQLEHRKTEIA